MLLTSQSTKGVLLKDIQTEKLCPSCKIIKPVNMYSYVKSTGYCSSYCKPCNARKANEYNRTPIGRAKRLARDRYKTTGCSPDMYNELKIKQDNKCAICLKDRDKFDRDFAADHCHKTGVVRGLLCWHCNVAIGKFSDDVVLLHSAITYLEKHGH